MMAEPQKEHQWLQKLVGKWTYESECVMGPDQPPMKATGTDTVRSLGGLWVLCEGQGEMPGCGPCTSIMTLGYDPQKKCYLGTFIASMMTHLWIYERGEMDPAGKVLTLPVEGPSMADPSAMAKYKDVIEFKGANHRTLSSHLLGEDGKWVQFMSASYRRTG